MSRTGIVVGWIAATVVATLLAFAAVSFVVGDLSRGPQVIGTLAVATSTSPSTLAPSIPGDTTLPTEVTPSSAPPGSTPSGSSSTSLPVGVPPTTTISPSSSTPSTTQPVGPGDSVVVAAIGGAASVSCSGAVVSVDWYTPTPGFSPEVDKGGPEEVELHFESKDWKSKIHADCEGGKVVFEVEEGAESS